MKDLKTYINEGFKLGKNKVSKTIEHKYFPKDRNELKEILKERLKYNHNEDLNDIDTSKITDMSKLFIFLDPHNIDISEWDVSKVEDMSYMFYECVKFNCDLSDWDVSNVKNMRCMFDSCNDFKGEGLEKWDIINVNSMGSMFDNCNKIKNKPSWYKN